MLVVAFPLFWQNRFDHFQPKARESAERNLSGPDRKSTRLNSSHGYISYAVFCLKKKILAVALREDVNGPADHPYQAIIDRNAFGLKPPPQVVNPIPTNPVVPVNVKFTGITSNSRGKKAWLMIPAQPGKNTNPQYLNGLAEHEKQGEIEVLEINVKESKVKILNAGSLVELNVKDNGLPTPAALPVPGVPLNSYGVPGALPTPGLVPAPGT